MKVTAFIPAKSFSQRITCKNIKIFCGYPLIFWSIRAAQKAKLVSRVLVSTDGKEIAKIAKSYGAEVVFRTKNNLDTLEEVISDYLNNYPKIKERLILLQPTSPVRTPEDIDNCIYKSAMSVCLEDDLFLWDKSEPFNFQKDNRKLYGKYYRENGSIYSCSKEGSRYGHKNFYSMPKWKSFELDIYEDWEMCEYFMRKLLKEEGNYAV